MLTLCKNTSIHSFSYIWPIVTPPFSWYTTPALFSKKGDSVYSHTCDRYLCYCSLVSSYLILGLFFPFDSGPAGCSLLRNPVIYSSILELFTCRWAASAQSFSSCLGVIKKSLFPLSLCPNSAGIVGRLEHPHTNVGWRAVNAPDVHWFKRPWLVSLFPKDSLLKSIVFSHLTCSFTYGLCWKCWVKSVLFCQLLIQWIWSWILFLHVAVPVNASQLNNNISKDRQPFLE